MSVYRLVYCCFDSTTIIISKQETGFSVSLVYSIRYSSYVCYVMRAMADDDDKRWRWRSILLVEVIQYLQGLRSWNFVRCYECVRRTKRCTISLFCSEIWINKGRNLLQPDDLMVAGWYNVDATMCTVLLNATADGTCNIQKTHDKISYLKDT